VTLLTQTSYIINVEDLQPISLKLRCSTFTVDHAWWSDLSSASSLPTWSAQTMGII